MAARRWRGLADYLTGWQGLGECFMRQYAASRRKRPRRPKSQRPAQLIYRWMMHRLATRALIGFVQYFPVWAGNAMVALGYACG